MATNKKRLLRKYCKIQNRYEELRIKYKKKPNKHKLCLIKLEEEFDLAHNTLDYIIFRQYDKKPQQIKNQLQFSYA